MANVNFRLKEPNKNGPTLIYLFFTHKGKVIKLSTGQKIDKKNWIPKKQRAKTNRETALNGDYELNSFLDALESHCRRTYNKLILNGIPSVELLEKDFRSFISGSSMISYNGNGLYDLIERFMTGEILYQGKQRSAATIKTYLTTYKHLKAFELALKFPVNFDTITIEFFDKFNAYLIKQKIGQNARSKYIKVLQVFLNEAIEQGLTQNIEFKKRRFQVKRTETEAVYLTTNEILLLYKTDLSSNPRLDRVRDLFVIGCFVGLRYSDVSRIKTHHIIIQNGKPCFKMITQKTKEEVIVPINPVIQLILEKYHGQTPPATSNQKFNDYIKEVAEIAGLNQIGRLSQNPEKLLFECISSHTARRSFATNLFLQGFPTIDIMKVTGHKSERSFLKYVKVSKEQSAVRLAEHNEKNWSNYTMSLVN